MMIPRRRPILLVVAASVVATNVVDGAWAFAQPRGSSTTTTHDLLRRAGTVPPRRQDAHKYSCSTRLFLLKDGTENNEDNSNDNKTDSEDDSSRRRWLTTAATAPLLLVLTSFPRSAWARGLVQFPCKRPLGNTYHLLRAGTSLLEEEGMWSTNPLFLTNRDDALSVAGEEQVVLACQQLKQDAPTVVKYSLAASAIDTSNIVGRELKLGRDRLVPEFTFLDPRAIGAYDMTDRSVTQPAIFALDNDEAGKDGLQGRPPPNEDGTPNESLADQAVRLRQVMSILESQYFKDTILLIFPDGTGPALLSGMIAGIPYNRVHELEFAPGEVRLNVNLESILGLWKTKQKENGEVYAATLEQGRANLKQLRAGKGTENLKDEKLEEERIAIETQMAEKEKVRAAAAEKENQARRERQRQLEQERLLIKQQQAAEGSSVPVLPAALGGAVGVGGLLAVLAGKNEEEDLSVQSEVVMANTTLSDKDAEDVVNLTETESLPIMDLSDANEAGAELFATTVPTIRKQRVNGDQNATFTATAEEKIVDPQEAAKRAMEEYMNQDDGATDWLLSLTEIINDDDDDDVADDGEEEFVVQQHDGSEGDGKSFQ